MYMVRLTSMDNMKEIWCGQLQSGSFPNLQFLEIRKCLLLEVVIAKEEEEDGVEDSTLLPNLYSIVLSELPSLESFCFVAHDLEFPNLRNVRVIECPQLKTFSPGFVYTPQLNKVILTDWDAEEEVNLWEENLNNTIAHLHKQRLIIQNQFGFRSLVPLEVGDMDTLENLANAAASSLLFTTVDTLSLKSMDELQQLSHRSLMAIVGIFGNLTNLCVSECNKLNYLFELSVATEFMHLQKIVIKDCKNMEAIIWKEHEEDETNTLVLPNLKELLIEDLPSLVSFCRGIDEVEFPHLIQLDLLKIPKVECLFSSLCNKSFFPHKVSFPSMEDILLNSMKNMKEIWCGQLQSGSFSNLFSLKVLSCPKLRVVFIPSGARCLLLLQTLTLSDCSLLEVVIAKKEEEDGVEDTTLLPKLKTIILSELPSLESFCFVAHDLVFPWLSDVSVIDCPQLKMLSPGIVRTPKLNKVRLTSEDAENQVSLWEDNLNNTIAHLYKQNQEGQQKHEDEISEE